MQEMKVFGKVDNDNVTSNNRIVLYHGSCGVIEKPLFDYGRADNDYGKGFYTTKLFDKAVSWAKNMGNPNKAIVNTYSLDLTDLNVINLKDYGVLAWIAKIASNRPLKSELSDDFLDDFIKKYKVDTTNADIIVGYRADDSYTDVIAAFIDGLLNCDEVQRLFYKGNLGEQYFLRSKKAFNTIEFVKWTDVQHRDITEQMNLEITTRQEVFKFIDQRRKAIAQRYYVNPITIIDALEDNYVYNKEYGFYEEIGG